jgi:hypothetical protein
VSRRSPSHDFHLPGDALHSLVTAGIGAVPAARYAMGCIAVAAALTVVLRTVPDPAVAVFGGLVMLAGMVLVAIVGRVAGGRDTALHSALRRPALALAWGVVGAAICVLALLISTTFWGLPTRSHPAQCADATSRETTSLAATCCRGTARSWRATDEPRKSGTRWLRSYPLSL